MNSFFKVLGVTVTILIILVIAGYLALKYLFGLLPH